MTPCEEYHKWLATFPDYISPDEGKSIVVRKPSDMDKVYDMLDTMEI